MLKTKQKIFDGVPSLIYLRIWRPSKTLIRSLLAILIISGCQASAQEPPPGVSANGSIEGFEAKFIAVNGIRTRYYEVGSGEPMVLVHGSGWSGTANANTWIPVLGHLASNYHVFAPDKLASGMTDNPDDPDKLTLRGEVDHLVQFVQTLGFEKIHLVGQSRGGGLAFQFAVLHPDMLHTLIIVDSSTASPVAGDERANRREKLMRHCPQEPWTAKWPCQYKALSYDPDSVDDLFVSSSIYMGELPKSQRTEEMMTPARRERNNKITSAMNHEAYHLILTEEVLQMPILLYWAKNDPSVLPIQAYSFFNILAETNPKARLFFTNRGGHFHYREHPEEFAHNVINFVDFWMGRTAMEMQRDR